MTGRPVLVDDHILLALFLGRQPSDLRPDGGAISTTGLWYHRLCRALAIDTVTGAMSQSLGRVDAALGTAAVGAVIELPEEIGLVSLRTLGWPMSLLLANGSRLNLLSLEALAAAKALGAEICLGEADDNPPLRTEAIRLGVPVRIVSG